jgi:hypothetical protein
MGTCLKISVLGFVFFYSKWFGMLLVESGNDCTCHLVAVNFFRLIKK